jgi:hypothetical protein
LDFGTGATIFTAEITRSEPENLGVSLAYDKTSVTFEKTLINPSEYFSVQVVGSNLADKPLADGRIVGVSTISISLKPQAVATNRLEVIAYMVIASIVTFGFAYLSYRNMRRRGEILQRLVEDTTLLKRTGEVAAEDGTFRFYRYVDRATRPLPRSDETTITLSKGEEFPHIRSSRKSAMWLSVELWNSLATLSKMIAPYNE